MADKVNCWEEMKVHFKRIWVSIRHPFKENPLTETDGGNMRIGWRDILEGHAFVNLFVEWCRVCPYTAGHFFFFVFLFLVMVLIYLLVF